MAELVEGARLEIEYAGKTRIEGSNPSLSAIFVQGQGLRAIAVFRAGSFLGVQKARIDWSRNFSSSTTQLPYC